MEDKFNLLIKELSDLSLEDITFFESKLEEIHSLNDRRSVKELCSLLNDNSPYDELMFSIIHVIESFEDDVYVEEIINSIEVITLKSPYWANVILLRIVNSESTLKVFLRCLQAKDQALKSFIKSRMVEISDMSVELKSKIDFFISSI